MSFSKHKTRRASKKTNRSRVGWWLLIVTSVFAVIAAGTIWLGPKPVSHDDADVVVYKTATCSCCHDWVDHLRDEGLTVAIVNVRETQTTQRRLGIPPQLGSCHTAKAGNYFVEGHVPADLIQRLLAEQPKHIRGIVVPGMPIGSPGMEGPNPVEYEVLSVNAQDEVEVFAVREGQPSQR